MTWDDDFIINVSASPDDLPATTQPKVIDNNMIDEVGQLLDELYLIMIRNTNLSEKDTKKS